MAESDADPLEPRGNQRAVIESDAACTSVDAGAGTGKTTTMLMRIEHAIEREGVDPGDVLVLTFATEAAASIREAVAERLEPDAAAAIDVYTYHSFCHGLVREYAYALGLSPEFDVVTGRRRRRIVGRLLAEGEYEFATASARGDGSPDELADEIDRFVGTMSREGISPDDLREALPSVRTLELCHEFVLWLERTAGERLSFDVDALRYFNREDHREAAREALIAYGKRVAYCREKIAEAPAAFREADLVRDVDRYLRALTHCVTNVIEALSLEEPTTKHLPRALFGNRIRGDATTRIEQTPLGRLKHYVEFLRLARHYAEVYADYHALLERERTLDFDELVRTATALLAGEADVADGPATRDSIADEVAGEWTQVYCDEFQDTDATQFELIRALTDAPDRPSLLAIGDKDQAIYGWRGTDREGLDRLATVHDDHESIELGLNFRSRQEILELVDRCDYGSQSAKTLREDGRQPGSYEDDDPPDRVVKVESDEIDDATADQVATTVSRLLTGDCENVPRRSLADVAVVVRTNRHARAVADALRDRRIPHEISGSPGGEITPGIRTLLSYLRVLVDATADVHLRRVLFYRYRLPDADLRTLQRRSGSLHEAVVDVDPATLEQPARLERARDHLAELEQLRDAAPLPAFVRRFRELTRLEWYLTGEERAELERVERFAERFTDDGAVETLSVAFVDALERSLRGSDRGPDRGSRSDEAIDVMTVHQAKGLEFDTVLVPYLSDEEWCVETDYARRARYQLLTATLDGDVESPLLADLATETVGEEWRVLHVALTRAANHCFLFGSSYDYDGAEDELAASTADDCLASAIEWSVTGQRMALWSSLRASFRQVRERYPDSVADRTTAVANATGGPPGRIGYRGADDEEPVEPGEAVRTIHRLGRLLRNGTLLAAADAASHGGADAIDRPVERRATALTTATVRFPSGALSRSDDSPAAIRHSYTGLEAHETCARKHYLEHVVRAFDDPVATSGDAAGSSDDLPSASRTVGTVFHDVAEEAVYRDYRTREAWREAAVRQLTARGDLEHREAVLDCVDRYFEATAPGVDAPVADWEPLAAELPVTLSDVDGVDGDVVGAVDAVRRHPEREGVAVLDYKTTASRIDADDATQLALYARACRERFDDPVAAVGYVYVGDVDGPRVDLLEHEALPPWSAVRDALASADDPAFAETTPGPHCRYCPHRSLGCAPAEYATDVDRTVETER